MLTNYDLAEISTHYGFKSIILMKDELADYKPKNGNYIINLESSTQGDGSHWLAIFVRGKNSYYQDSFGVIPPIEVIDFCKRIPNSHLGYNVMEIQNINAETCGWYAVGILIHLNRTKKKDIFKSAQEFNNQFSSDTTKNNTIPEKTAHIAGKYLYTSTRSQK